jgi:CubicO group peptidase (beta-lactamase class C family)
MSSLSVRSIKAFTAAGFIFLFSAAGFAQISTEKLAEFEKAVIAEVASTRTPGAAVGIVSGDRIIYSKGFGTESIEGGSNISADTLFRIGSTTKMLTAASAAILAENGKVRFDAPASTYVADLPAKIGKLTLHQLLSQSSGIRDMPTPIRSDDDSALSLNVAGWKDDAFFTEPSTIYSYSSANFWLAGLIVERVHGKPYADAMADLLFAPLGMTRTFLRPRDAMTYPLALGHDRSGTSHSIVRPAPNNAAIYPGGSVYSSVNELSRWAIALLNGGVLNGKQVLPASVTENLLRSQFTLPGGQAYYSYGMLGYDIAGVPTIGHGGVSRGYGATLFFVPKMKLGVIVLTNSNGQTLSASRQKFNELFLPAPQSVDPAATKAARMATDISAFAGTFEHAPQRWVITLESGNLYVTSDGKRSELKRRSDLEFSSDQGPLVFVPGPNGEVDHIFMGLYAAKRVEQISHSDAK